MPVFDFPTGTIVPHASITIPAGWVPCDGTTYNGTNDAYSNLWSVLGTTYGGSGQSAFAVPNLGARVPVGPKASANVSITNPSFATNTTGVTTAQGSTATRDTSVFESSPASVRWDKSGTSNTLDFGSQIQFALSGTFTAGVTYTLTFKVRASAGSWLEAAFGVASTSGPLALNDTAFVNLNFNNYGYYNGYSGIPTSGWATCVISWTPTTTASSGVNLVIMDKTAFFTTAGYFWFDSFSIASTEGDGGLGTWSGSTTHSLTASQTGIKNHRHGITDPGHSHGGSAAGSHYHTVRYSGGNIIDQKNADRNTKHPDGGNPGLEYTSADNPSSVTFGSGTLNGIAVSPSTTTHASSAHTNIQPEVAFNYIIKL